VEERQSDKTEHQAGVAVCIGVFGSRGKKLAENGASDYLTGVCFSHQWPGGFFPILARTFRAARLSEEVRPYRVPACRQTRRKTSKNLQSSGWLVDILNYPVHYVM
jgi:hypothetical protein